VCMLCTCVSEYHRDGEGADLQELSLLSYTRKYISLTAESAVLSARGWGTFR
jgi:hypothetical protein